MSDYHDYQDVESPVLSGPAPTDEPDNPLVPVSLVATLTKAEIDQQISTAHQFPRSPATARDKMIGLATLDDQMAAECIYSVPRGGKQIRGPSIRFAEIVLSCWGNIRCAARVSHEDRIERYVEAEAIVHDLETNVGYVARARRRIELKRGRKTVDPDMIQLAGAAAISVARRNAILGAVPKPVWRKAHEAVEAVIRGDQKTLVERRDAAVAFFNKAGVPTERILKSLEVAHLDDLTLDHLVDLNGMRAALKTGESTLDQLFPEERAPGPKPETLTDKLEMLAKVDPQTGEIKESGAETTARASNASGGAGAANAPPSTETAPASPAEAEAMRDHEGRIARHNRILDEEKGKAPQRGPRGARKASPHERLQVEGDIAAAKGTRALNEWWNSLSEDDVAHITAIMDRAWRETAKQKDGAA